MSDLQQAHEPPSPALPDGAPTEVAERGTIEDRARRMGWKPKDEYKGDPERWTPADQFYERAIETMPVLQERLPVVERRAEAAEREARRANEKLAEQMTVLTEMASHLRKAEERAYDKAKRELEARQREAVANADTGAFEVARQELQALEVPKSPPPPPPPPAASAPAPAPEVMDFKRRNPWFDDPNFSDVVETATAYHFDLQRRHPEYTLAQNLAEVEKRTKMIHPDRFENTRRAQPPTVNGSAPAPSIRSGTNGRGYSDLPADAKKACDKFVASIKGFTREDYCKTYDWSE